MSDIDIPLMLFSFALFVNAIAFVRHWLMMQRLQVVLYQLIEAQREFDALMFETKRNNP